MQPIQSQTATGRRQFGFTLVELLVVIGIIAALASLLLVGGRSAIISAREGAIHAEIQQLDAGFTEYTNQFSGGAYPPNVITSQYYGNGGPQPQNQGIRQAVYDSFRRHFNRAFPSHREPDVLLAKLAGVTVSGTTVTGQVTDGLDAGPAQGLAGGLSPYEAVVFWLGGFSDDSKYPISGPGGPSFNVADPAGEDFAARDPIFDFDVARLGPRGADGNQFGGRAIQYQVNLNGVVQTRRINLWVYLPRNRTVPYAYFHAPKNPKFDPVHDGVVGIKQLKLGAHPPLLIGDYRYVNEGQCQILSAGMDDAWGPIAGVMGVNYTAGPTAPGPGDRLLYPDGPFTGELADTITNFSTQTTLEDSQP